MSTSSSLDTDLMAVEEKLARSLMEHLDFGPSGVEHVYNPIDHAWDLHTDFLAKYYSGGGESPRPIMFLGMNPGPWGMAQTGRASWRPQFSLKNRLGTGHATYLSMKNHAKNFFYHLFMYRLTDIR